MQRAPWGWSIQPSNFDFVTATIMLAKKDSTRLWIEKRMCEDYRPLNLVTPQDMYPMPILEELFDNIGDSNIFIIMDMRQVFNQIMLVAKDYKKTTFHGSNKLWEWLVMPFGLKNAPIFFQQVMDQVLARADFLKCYMMSYYIAKDSYNIWLILRSYSKGSTKSIWRSILKSVSLLSPQ